MLRKALMVRADSFVLPIFAICIWLLVLIVRRWRHLRRRLDRNRTDFVRPRSFPAQRKRDIPLIPESARPSPRAVPRPGLPTTRR